MFTCIQAVIIGQLVHLWIVNNFRMKWSNRRDMSSLLRGCLHHLRQSRTCSHTMCPQPAILPHIRLCQTHADAICDSSGKIKPEPIRTKRREVFRAFFYIGIGECQLIQSLWIGNQASLFIITIWHLTNAKVSYRNIIHPSFLY